MKYLDLLTSNKVINLSSKNKYYLTFFIVILILIRIFSTYNFTLTNLLNILLIFSIIFMICKNIRKTFIYTLIFILLYIFIISFILKNNYENFENSEDEVQKKDEDQKKPYDNKDNLRAELDTLIKKFEAQHNSGSSNIDTSKLEKYTDRLKGKIELKDDDTTENEPVGIDTSKMVHDEIKPDPLKKAQKETYELIDTIGILKETVQSLNPVLSEGKKVMDLFKGLNMDGLENDKIDSLSALLGKSDKEKK